MLTRQTYIFWYHMTTEQTVMGGNTCSERSQSGKSQSLFAKILQVTKINIH